eukprot:GDKK01063685.1.p1 GENE.GDKK01063685.1~~GDKK01063685.1.p1  ORF type:complete len:106 (+),score=1.94 GDKK01063685.1:132-449(+)
MKENRVQQQNRNRLGHHLFFHFESSFETKKQPTIEKNTCHLALLTRLYHEMLLKKRKQKGNNFTDLGGHRTAINWSASKTVHLSNTTSENALRSTPIHSTTLIHM